MRGAGEGLDRKGGKKVSKTGVPKMTPTICDAQFVGFFFLPFSATFQPLPPCWAQCTSCSLPTSLVPIFSLD